MSYQLQGNDQRLREFSKERYRDLRTEADQERLAGQAPKSKRTAPSLAYALVPLSVGLALLLRALTALA